MVPQKRWRPDKVVNEDGADADADAGDGGVGVSQTNRKVCFLPRKVQG